MPTRLYIAYNGHMPTTAAPAKVTTSNVITTMLQLSTASTGGIEVVEWGISFDGSAAATPGAVELVDTDAINATVTAFVAADIMKFNQNSNALAQQALTLGTANSGFTSSAEGSTTTTREFDVQLLPPTAPYLKQFPLERGPELIASKFLRTRVTFGTAINSLSYIVWAE